ncbi:MAG: hypothetical protein NUV75_01805 [Gallionella sp.]|nr:hypothetical protein [Gallionella sp.]
MSDRFMVDHTYNAGTDKKPDWRRLRYMISGSNIQDRFQDRNAHELAMEKTKAMLKGREA